MSVDEEARAAGLQGAPATAADQAAGSIEVKARPAFGKKYSDLVAFADQTSDFRVPEQQAKNRLSALNKYLVHLGLDAESQVSTELASGLDETLVDFVRAMEREGLSPGTISNIRTFIKQWARMWAAYVEVSTAPGFDGIGAALAYYFDKAKVGAEKEGRKISLGKAAQLHGLRRTAYDHLMSHKNGTKVTYFQREAIEALEGYLGAPLTSLTRFIGFSSAGLNEMTARTQGTVYGAKLASLQKIQYRLKDLPPQLTREVREFIKFKTAITPLLERNEKWRTQPRQMYSGTEDDWKIISIDGKTFSASASVFLNHVRRFFGSKVLNGADPNGFSLVQMCDLQQQADYLEFCAERTGSLTEGSLAVLQLAQSFLYSKGGWIYQQPSFGALLPAPVSSDEATWHAWCSARRAEIGKRVAKLEKDRLIKPGRDTEEAIKDILDRQHPLTALFEMADAMENYLVKYESQPRYMNGHSKAALQRDILIIKIFTAQPLRVKMMRDLLYKKDNTGNLYRKKNGDWAIRFAPEDFKNERGAASDKPYDVTLPKDLYQEIDYYLNHIRHGAAFGWDTSDHVFVPQQKSNSVKDRKTSWINRMLLSRSKQFLPGCPGFGPHAIRHIVATDYIKNNPASYIVAADILHDKLETVMSAYAHLKAADGHRVYLGYRSLVAEAWKKGNL